MTECDGEYPTIIGADAKFNGELSFEKGVRIEGGFDGQIRSKGVLHVAQGAKVAANIEAANVKIEGECKGNLVVSEKLHLLATARMEGDLRANRLEIADGAIFIGNVTVGQAATETARRPATREAGASETSAPVSDHSRPSPSPQPPVPGMIRPRPQEMKIPAGSP